MRIQQYLSEDALEKLQEVLEYDIPEYAGDRDYMELMDIVNMDYYDAPDDLIDEDGIADRVREHLDGGWLSAAKNMLTDIDLGATYWIIDWNGRPRDIDSWDCEYLKKEIISELEDQLDDKDMKRWEKIKKKYGLD